MRSKLPFRCQKCSACRVAISWSSRPPRAPRISTEAPTLATVAEQELEAGTGTGAALAEGGGRYLYSFEEFLFPTSFPSDGARIGTEGVSRGTRGAGTW